MTVGCSLTTPIRPLHSLRSLHRAACKSYLVIVVTLLSSSVYATEPPATKIDADELRHDEQKLVTEFRGNVSLNRGALSLQGDALELEQLPNSGMKGRVTGQPARFQQKPANSNESVEGQGKTILYNSQTEIVVIDGEAVLRRLLNGRVIDTVAGDRLVYDQVTQTYRVESTPGQPRTRMTLMPRPAQPSQTPAPGPSTSNPTKP
ncbi:MAG: lipopolysaccharide transport periplasmic protein LptA [Burkholderiaceae bacterium]